MRRISLLTALLLALVGCAPGPAAPTAPVPLTNRVIAEIVQQHLGEGFVAAPDGASGLGAQVYYRATPDQPSRTVIADYRADPWPLNESGCEPMSSEAPQFDCFEESGVRIYWQPQSQGFGVVGARSGGFATVWVGGPDMGGDPRQSPGKVDLDAVITLANDPRLDATTEPGLLAAAAQRQNWREDRDCEGSPLSGPIDLPSDLGPASETPTPQGLAALIAAHVPVSCVGEWRQGTGAGGIAHLGSSSEWVAVYLTTAKTVTTCSGADECRRDGDLTISAMLDVPEEHAATRRVVRRLETGYLVVLEGTMKVEDGRRVFPVSEAVLKQIATDPRAGTLVSPELNRAGDELGLCWRLNGVVGET